MVDAGVLHELRRGESLLQTISRSGLTNLCKHHLVKVPEAAMVEFYEPCSKHSLILTGLEMFERVDGKFLGSQDQTMLYWTELPEFSRLQAHRRTWESDDEGGRDESLRKKLSYLGSVEGIDTLTGEFLEFPAKLLGFSQEIFDPKSGLAAYGLDSLSGVSCQYWFHRELNVGMAVPDILGAISIEKLVEKDKAAEPAATIDDTGDLAAEKLL